MEVNLDVIEKAITRIFSDLRSRGVDNFKVDADFYWSIPSEKIYDPYTLPTELDIGQLEEDYDILVQMSNKDLLIGHNLKNVAELLRYLSEKYPA